MKRRKLRKPKKMPTRTKNAPISVCKKVLTFLIIEEGVHFKKFMALGEVTTKGDDCDLQRVRCNVDASSILAGGGIGPGGAERGCLPSSCLRAVTGS